MRLCSTACSQCSRLVVRMPPRRTTKRSPPRAASWQNSSPTRSRRSCKSAATKPPATASAPFAAPCCTRPFPCHENAPATPRRQRPPPPRHSAAMQKRKPPVRQKPDAHQDLRPAPDARVRLEEKGKFAPVADAIAGHRQHGRHRDQLEHRRQDAARRARKRRRDEAAPRHRRIARLPQLPQTLRRLTP